MPITVYTTAYMALLFATLSLNVIRLRRVHKVSLGDGGYEVLNRAIRAHGNFVEYVPFALFSLLLCEWNELSSNLCTVVALCLVVGRSCHAMRMGFTLGPSVLRQIGMALTLGSFLIATIALLIQKVFQP